MLIRLPGLDIREPLKPRPISGGIVGALVGLVFALVAQSGAFAVPRDVQSLGFLSGGLVAGATVGSLAPLFRRRASAGLAVWLAATSGLFVANYSWHEYEDPVGSILLGLVAGVVYAALFWDYRAETRGKSN